MTTKNTVAEETKANSDANIKSKVNSADKTKKLDTSLVPGQKETVLNKTPNVEPTDDLPDYAQDVNKDKSKASQVALKGGPAKDGLAEDTDEDITEEEYLEERANMRSHVLKKVAARLQKHGKGAKVSPEALARALGPDSKRKPHGLMWELKQHGINIVPSKKGKKVSYYSMGEDVEQTDENETLTEADTLIDMSEHVEALFEGVDNLSDDFKAKTTTIFEAAVALEVSELADHLSESVLDVLEEEHDALVESYDEKIKKVLSYVVEQWMDENRVAIQPSLKAELTEDFIVGLKALFEQHYIDIPDDKVDVVESLTEKISSLEDTLNEQMEINISLKDQINESVKTHLVNELSEGLTEVDAVKFTELCESVSFENTEDFTVKAKTLKESYFTKKTKATGPDQLQTEKVLTEEEHNAEVIAEKKTSEVKTVVTEEKNSETVVDPRRAAYASALKRFAGRK